MRDGNMEYPGCLLAQWTRSRQDKSNSYKSESFLSDLQNHIAKNARNLELFL